MKNLEQFLKERAVILIIAVLFSIAFLWIESLEPRENTMFSKGVLRVGMTITVILLLLLSSWIISYIKNRKNLKKYTDNQIKIAKDILAGKIQCTNDFIFLHFDTKPRKPRNKNDKNRNIIILDNDDTIHLLLSDLKNIMADILSHNYIDVETDINIETLTHLKIYSQVKNDIRVFHDINVSLNKEFKQKRVIVKNPKQLKKLVKLKYLPKQN